MGGGLRADRVVARRPLARLRPRWDLGGSAGRDATAPIGRRRRLRVVARQSNSRRGDARRRRCRRPPRWAKAAASELERLSLARRGPERRLHVRARVVAGRTVARAGGARIPDLGRRARRPWPPSRRGQGSAEPPRLDAALACAEAGGTDREHRARRRPPRAGRPRAGARPRRGRGPRRVHHRADTKRLRPRRRLDACDEIRHACPPRALWAAAQSTSTRSVPSPSREHASPGARTAAAATTRRRA